MKRTGSPKNSMSKTMKYDEHNIPPPEELYKMGEETRKQSPELDWEVINTIRTLAADTVQKAKSGHPGAPMGLAPLAYLIFSKHIRFNPKNPHWFGRDRFVLSNGHACALQYCILHLFGYDLPLDQLKHFRQVGSMTPGHPEYGYTPGIEVTTGPLGQGISNAVGLAMAEKHLEAIFNKPGFDIVNNYTYCIVGDGCLQEGVCAEAVSLAGHLGLGKLIVFYDDNHVQIDGSTELAFTEDVLKRFESYGWHTQHVEDGDNDLIGIENAIVEAKKVTDKPSLIKVTTTIGYGSIHQGTEKVHGAPLGDDVIKSVKKLFGFDPEKTFNVPEKVSKFTEAYIPKGNDLEKAYNDLLGKYRQAHPELAKDFDRRVKGEFPAGWQDALPRFTPQDKPLATRKFSEGVLNKLAGVLPELIGGSADLTGSNFTQISKDFQKDTPDGRYIRFGVREHGMAAICNGLIAYGAVIPFCATFLNFIGYAQGAYRLSALSHHGVIYVMTHDSIGLGEDGPTHQPIETLPSLRATPNVMVFRPADGNEVTGSYIMAIERRKSPSVISLTRQNVPNLEGSSVEKVSKGGYILQGDENPQVILVSTGSELSICVDAAKLLREKNIKVRVVSMPCTYLFDEQSLEYQRSVFPDGIPSISVEAASTLGWSRYSHVSLGIDRFGESAPYQDLYKKFGLVPEVISEKTIKVLEYYKKNQPQQLFKPALF